jgi:S1-C subfamily serine protease
MRSLLKRKLFAAVALAGLVAAPVSLVAAESAKKPAKPYLGIGVSAQTKEANQDGVTLKEVSPDGPAAKAGLKEGDRVVMAGDKKVTRFKDVVDALANHKAGDKLVFKVIRDGKEQAITVTLGEQPKQKEEAKSAEKSPAYLGVYTQVLSPELKERLELKADKGVLVTEVLPGSPAAKAGLAEEDVITHVDDVAVNNPNDLRSAIEKVGAGKEVALKVMRGKKEMELKAQLQALPAGERFLGKGIEMPEGFDQFPGHFRSFFHDGAKTAELEKKVQELQERVHQLEQKLNK